MIINPNYKKGIVIITLDDGFESDYSYAYRELKRRGLTSTSFIIGSLIQTAQTERIRMNWSQIKAMKEKGFNIECHSYTHPHLGTLSEQEVREELENNDLTFLNHGLSKPNHHAFPYGNYTQETVRIVKEYRSTMRAASKGFPYPVNSKERIRAQLPILSTNCDINSNLRFQQVKGIIDFAEKNNLILLIHTHELRDDVTDYAGLKSYYIKLLDYLLTKNMLLTTLDSIVVIQESDFADK